MALQVAALLVISLLAAQAVSMLVILTMEPPRPSVYRLQEVAGALRGETVPPGGRRPLVRETVNDAPILDDQDEARPRMAAERMRAELAGLLQVSPDRVRLSEPGPSVMAMLAVGGGPRRRMFNDERPPPGEPGGFGPGGPMGPSGGMGRRPPNMRLMSFPLVGDFTAAMMQADGSWTVVRPRPEPFPNAWQTRILLWLAGCLLVLAPLGYWFARRITAPIDQFARAAEAFGRDPHSPRMALDGPAEIGRAAQAFNEMQARLSRYVQHRTAMVGAISHDLRTPLARIRFKLELEDSDKAAILGDVEQMEQMITAVLAFIRDAGTPVRREPLDLLSLLEVVVDEAALQGEPGEVSGDPVVVDGDPLALKRLFANLVGNALKYGEEARVTVAQEDESAVVRIADRGPGLPSRDLERVFEPFYRAAEARTLDAGGVGLGLAIARSIAVAHAGEIHLESSPRGLTAVVRLPLAASVIAAQD